MLNDTHSPNDCYDYREPRRRSAYRECSVCYHTYHEDCVTIIDGEFVCEDCLKEQQGNA